MIVSAGLAVVLPSPVLAQDQAGEWVRNGQTVRIGNLAKDSQAVYNLALPEEVGSGCISFTEADGLSTIWYTFSYSAFSGCLNWEGPAGNQTCEACGPRPGCTLSDVAAFGCITSAATLPPRASPASSVARPAQ